MNIFVQAYRKFKYNNRNYYHKYVKKNANVSNKEILEIGSGQCTVEQFFKNNTFVKSDLDEKYGYSIVKEL